MSRENEVRWNIRLPATLAARVEELLGDAILGKPAYGARKVLIEHLLNLWLKSEQGELYLNNQLVVLPEPPNLFRNEKVPIPPYSPSSTPDLTDENPYE